MFSHNYLRLRSSKTYLIICVSLTLLMLAAVLIVQLNIVTQSVLCLLLLLNFCWQYSQRYRQTDPLSVVALRWDVENHYIALQQCNGEWLRAIEIKQRLVMPGLVYLLIKSDKRLLPISVCVFHDSCSKQQFRRLKVLSLHAVNRFNASEN